jgi:hypothetical protein
MDRPATRQINWRWQEVIGLLDKKTLSGHQSVFFNRLMDLGDPVEEYDAVNKKYVDDALSDDELSMTIHLATYDHAHIHPSNVVDGDLVNVAGRNVNDALIWGGAAWGPASVILSDGSVALSADWDAGSHKIRAQIFESDQVTGIAPFIVASTTKVTNLNADKLNGLADTAFLKHDLATAANDFLVASGPGVFVKKSLSETQTILVPKWSINEIPTGSINGVNMVFTLAHTPIDQIMLYLNGQYMTPDEDYTISGVTITMASAPIVGDKIIVNYPYLVV